MSVTPEERVSLKEAYDIIDISGDGLISVDELQRFLMLDGEFVSREEAIESLKKFDTDRSGDISFQEFLDFMVKWREEERAVRKKGDTAIWYERSTCDC